MSNSPYYSISYYYNLKAFLGKNPLIWFIPIGTGFEEKYPESNGYDFSINEKYYLDYLRMLNEEGCKKQEEKNSKENCDKQKNDILGTLDEKEFETNMSNEKLNKSIDLNNISSKNNILIQENYFLIEENDENSTRLYDNITNDYNKNSENSGKKKKDANKNNSDSQNENKDSSKDKLNGLKK